MQVLPMAIFLILSLKKIWFIELVQPISFISMALTFLVLNTANIFDHLDSDQRQRQIHLIPFIYLIHVQFSTSVWFESMIMRLPIYSLTVVVFLAHRVSLNDETNFVQGLALLVSIIPCFELNVYNNIKAQTKLFHQVKQLMQ